MTTTKKIKSPKTNIKNATNTVVQANFIQAVSDLVTAENSVESARKLLVTVTLDLLDGVTELTYADRELVKDMLVLGYQKKYADEEIAEKRATSQFGKIRKDLENDHNIVFLPKETKEAVNKSKNREVTAKREEQQLERVAQIEVANDMTPEESVSTLSSNIVESGGQPLSSAQQKSLLKKIENKKFKLAAKKELLKEIRSQLTYGNKRQDELKSLDINVLIKIAELLNPSD